jgi:hypothetical protein
MSDARFHVKRIVDGLRFEATDGWVDLTIDGEGRGEIHAGTFNGTTAPIFGGRVWKLLKDTMPELGLKVVSAEFLADPFMEEIYVCAGFQREGVRRGAGPELKDLVGYSILDSEVRYEVSEPAESQEAANAESISAK